MKNHSFQGFEHFKSRTFQAILVLTILGGLFIYTFVYGLNPFLSLYYTFLLFLGDVKQPAEIGFENKDFPNWILILFPAFTALLITLWSAIKVLYREDKLTNRKKDILKYGDHIIVVGLTENTKVYIDSESEGNRSKMIMVEPDSHNAFIQSYLDDFIPVMIKNPTDSDLLNELKIENAKHIVISSGDDMTNLEIATQMFDTYKGKIKDLPVYLNIEDRTLRLFHKENGLFHGMNVKLFSIFADSARELFEKYDIDGSSNDIIHSDKPYGIVVIGNTKLAQEVIYQACIMGQLPNKNRLTIYCIDRDVDNFKNEVELNYRGINSIPTVQLVYIASHTNSLAFYRDTFWDENITNVILCKDNEQENLDIASSIANITYLEELVKGTLKTKILIAMFNSYSLSNTLKQHDGIFKNFFVFGGKHDINDRKYLIDEERDTMAKAVNYVYSTASSSIPVDDENYAFTYTHIIFNQTDSENAWKKLSYFTKESNRAVADHLRTKLKYLGFDIQKCNEEYEKLLLQNQKVFEKNVFDEYLLAENEHTRWNAFHYLHGYNRIDFQPKSEKKSNSVLHELLKVHMCLVDDYDFFRVNENEFIKNGYSKWELVKYDFLINHHIPFIMARAKYILCKKT